MIMIIINMIIIIVIIIISLQHNHTDKHNKCGQQKEKKRKIFALL